MLEEDRFVLQDRLYQRVGELHAHFGRFDMYAVAIADVLATANRFLEPPDVTIENRGSHIVQLLEARGVEPRLRSEFARIYTELKIILARHVVAARNAAIIEPDVDPPRISSPSAPRSQAKVRDWFEQGEATSVAEITMFVELMEREIVRMAALTLRLAAFALDLKRHLAATGHA
jgi:hypothetical protein